MKSTDIKTEKDLNTHLAQRELDKIAQHQRDRRTQHVAKVIVTAIALVVVLASLASPVFKTNLTDFVTSTVSHYGFLYSVMIGLIINLIYQLFNPPHP